MAANAWSDLADYHDEHSPRLRLRHPDVAVAALAAHAALKGAKHARIDVGGAVAPPPPPPHHRKGGKRRSASILGLAHDAVVDAQRALAGADATFAMPDLDDEFLAAGWRDRLPAARALYGEWGAACRENSDWGAVAKDHRRRLFAGCASLTAPDGLAAASAAYAACYLAQAQKVGDAAGEVAPSLAWPWMVADDVLCHLKRAKQAAGDAGAARDAGARLPHVVAPSQLRF
jgi:hypothetical protein